jgi:hypothetical protein
MLASTRWQSPPLHRRGVDVFQPPKDRHRGRKTHLSCSPPPCEGVTAVSLPPCGDHLHLLLCITDRRKKWLFIPILVSTNDWNVKIAPQRVPELQISPQGQVIKKVSSWETWKVCSRPQNGHQLYESCAYTFFHAKCYSSKVNERNTNASDL